MFFSPSQTVTRFYRTPHVLAMPSLSEKIEHLIGRSLASIRQHDAKLFTKAQAFTDQPEPTIAVLSPECGSTDDAQLQTAHTPMGANRFPQLEWHAMDAGRTRAEGLVAEYLVVVEDPDAPLPAPVVHGIYYGIPGGKTALSPKDFEPLPDGGNMLRGGFRFGRNRMKSIWGGPKPVLGHGPHRYIFQVVGLRSTLDVGMLGQAPTKIDLERAVEGKVAAWGQWVGTFERKLASVGAVSRRGV